MYSEEILTSGVLGLKAIATLGFILKGAIGNLLRRGVGCITSVRKMVRRIVRHT
jgi:hypothetical protein